ncbi:MAG: T9SS type A sorting domain-containing protein [Bacteroidota bacterium]|nr:T9SS type A sorting domain-containing protein [Bacteroidota bacterium]
MKDKVKTINKIGIFLLIIIFLSFSNFVFSQNKTKKKVIQIELVDEDGKNINKEIIITRSDTGISVKTYKNQELINEKSLNEINKQINKGIENAKKVIIVSTDSFQNKIYTVKTEKILLKIEQSLQQAAEEIDVEQIIEEINKSIQSIDFEKLIKIDEVEKEAIKKNLDSLKMGVKKTKEDIVKSINNKKVVVIRIEGEDTEEISKVIMNDKDVNKKKIIVKIKQVDNKIIIEDFSEKSYVNNKNNLKLEGLNFNSSNESITVEFYNKTSKKVTVGVYTIDGKAIIEDSVTGEGIKKIKIENNFKKGIYILEIKRGNKSLTKKMIVE